MGKLSVFHGTNDEDVVAFVRDFKRACIGNNERKKEEWAILLPEFLEGAVYTWYGEHLKSR